MTLVEFLTARLAEDEAVARKATEGPWVAQHGGVDGAHFQPVVMSGYDSAGSIQDACEVEDAAHIARHDPARVLREVEAKRAIVRLVSGDLYDGRVKDSEWLRVQEPTLRALASIYSDHPDYDESWRP